MQRYFAEKNVARRSALLRELVFACPPEGKEFFRRAFQKERYLDLKLTAVRGYAFYASEDEVVPLMEKLLALLQKRPERTPYDYQEYEVMRSQYLRCPTCWKNTATPASGRLTRSWKHNTPPCRGYSSIYLPATSGAIFSSSETKRKSRPPWQNFSQGKIDPPPYEA